MWSQSNNYFWIGILKEKIKKQSRFLVLKVHLKRLTIEGIFFWRVRLNKIFHQQIILCSKK